MTQSGCRALTEKTNFARNPRWADQYLALAERRHGIRAWRHGKTAARSEHLIPRLLIDICKIDFIILSNERWHALLDRRG